MAGSSSVLAEKRKEITNMKCTDCCFCWKEEDEDYPTCHWESRAPDDMAPCEYAEDYDTDGSENLKGGGW